MNAQARPLFPHLSKGHDQFYPPGCPEGRRGNRCKALAEHVSTLAPAFLSPSTPDPTA